MKEDPTTPGSLIAQGGAGINRPAPLMQSRLLQRLTPLLQSPALRFCASVPLR